MQMSSKFPLFFCLLKKKKNQSFKSEAGIYGAPVAAPRLGPLMLILMQRGARGQCLLFVLEKLVGFSLNSVTLWGHSCLCGIRDKPGEEH